MGDQGPLLKLVLLCYISLKIKLSSILCLTVLCVKDSNTKMQWAEVFRLLLLVIDKGCHLHDSYTMIKMKRKKKKKK